MTFVITFYALLALMPGIMIALPESHALMMEKCTDIFIALTAPPRTVTDAAQRLTTILSNEQKLMIALMTEGELADLRYTLGKDIRKAFDLDNPDSALLADCASGDPGAAAELIIHRVWKTLTD